jgi:hypothetical protein
MGAVTLNERARPLAELYIASASEQTAPFLEALRGCPGRYREMSPGNTIFLSGVVQNANREIGVPGIQPMRIEENSDLFLAATVPFLPF